MCYIYKNTNIMLFKINQQFSRENRKNVQTVRAAIWRVAARRRIPYILNTMNQGTDR